MKTTDPAHLAVGLALASLAFGCVAAKPAGASTVQRDAPVLDPLTSELRAAMLRAAVDLERAGYRVDVSRVSIEALGDERFDAAAAQHRDALDPDARRVDAYFDLVRAAGGSQLSREMLLGGFAGEMPAFFDPDSGVVRVRERVASDQAALHSVLVHELVHAWQSQNGVLPQLSCAPSKLEAWNMLRCMLEGEAMLVAELAINGRLTASAENLPELLPARAFEQNILIYAAGLRSLLVAGAPVAAPFTPSEMPRNFASTEQILHPKDLRSDLPRGVELPSPIGAVVRDDSLGEMAILVLLRQLGLGRLEASLAACGWGGDALRTETLADGQRRVLWVSDWDTPGDAQQFAEALRSAGAATVTRDGSRVTLDTHPESDGVQLIDASTREVRRRPDVLAAEARLREDFRRELREGTAWWTDPRSGVRIPFPPNWIPGGRNGAAVIVTGSPKDDSLGFVNVTVGPWPWTKFRPEHMPRIVPTEWVLESEISELHGEQRLSCIAEVPAEVSGDRSRERPRGRMRALAVLRPCQLVRVIAGCSERAWPRMQEQMAAMLAEAKFD